MLCNANPRKAKKIKATMKNGHKGKINEAQ